MKIICFGDSNTWGYDPRGYFGGQYDHPWPEILAGELGCTVVNYGENGREIPTRNVEFPEDMDLLIIMLGTNDLLQGTSPEAVCGRMEDFLKLQNPAKLLLVAPPLMKLGAWVPQQNLVERSESLTKYYKNLAEDQRILFADAGHWNLPVCYDGVHLTEEGHRAFAENLMKYLIKVV